MVRVLSTKTTIECGFNAMVHSFTSRQVFSKLYSVSVTGPGRELRVMN
jgi:hypothetical protein